VGILLEANMSRHLSRLGSGEYLSTPEPTPVVGPEVNISMISFMPGKLILSLGHGGKRMGELNADGWHSFPIQEPNAWTPTAAQLAALQAVMDAFTPA
jgi:hypothetical protein